MFGGNSSGPRTTHSPRLPPTHTTVCKTEDKTNSRLKQCSESSISINWWGQWFTSPIFAVPYYFLVGNSVPSLLELSRSRKDLATEWILPASVLKVRGHLLNVPMRGKQPQGKRSCRWAKYHRNSQGVPETHMLPVSSTVLNPCQAFKPKFSSHTYKITKQNKIPHH